MSLRVPRHLHIVHEPARLALLTLLYRQGDVGAAAAREATGLTAGNLDSHARRLAAAGLVEARRVLQRNGFEARYRLTAAGLQAMRDYLAWLESFVAAAQE